MLRWAAAAIRDLESIRMHIARDNPAAADRNLSEIVARTSLLTEHPGIGRPGRVDGTRELVLSGLPYIVVYRAGPGAVAIVRVIHGAMNWPGTF